MAGHEPPAVTSNDDQIDEPSSSTQDVNEISDAAPSSSETSSPPPLLSERCSGYFVQPV